MKYFLIFALTVIASCDAAENIQSNADQAFMPLVNKENAWYSAAEKQIEQNRLIAQAIKNHEGAAKNIILFIGDGMNLTTVTASRIYEGQQQGLLGEENNLSFDNFPFSGLAKTYAVDTQVPDSASTMTAIISGIKTNKGIVGIDESVIRGDCSTKKGNEVISALDLAEIAGLSTGIVTTTRVTHATPAATYAKSPDRDWEDSSKMSKQAIDSGAFSEVEDQDCEENYSTVSSPVRFHNSDDGPKGPAPKLGQDNFEVLKSIGINEDQINELIDRGIVGNSQK